MTAPGAIDCDVHPTVPDNKVLLPYLDDVLARLCFERGITSLELMSYPPKSPMTSRPEWRGRTASPRPTPASWARRCSIVGSPAPRSELPLRRASFVQRGHGEGVRRAVNDWIAKEWLDRDPRLRASIVIPLQNVEYAVDEIERCAKDKRFVQVLVLAMQELPLGRRHFWPIYAACERHGLPLGIHAGSAYRNPVTSLGWPTMVHRGLCQPVAGISVAGREPDRRRRVRQDPALKVVLIESGVTWLPGFLWRFGKFWRGLRTEVPWVDRAPWEIVRDHFRLTIQPLDAPETAEAVERALDHLHSDDILLYASDYPHWQFDGDAVMPAGISPALQRKIAIDNPLATYVRLKDGAG